MFGVVASVLAVMVCKRMQQFPPMLAHHACWSITRGYCVAVSQSCANGCNIVKLRFVVTRTKEMWGLFAGGDSHMKQTGMLVVSLVNFGFWSRLGCSEQSANILSRQGLVQGSAKNLRFMTMLLKLLLTIIPFYPCPGLGREYKDRHPDEWTVLEGQQHLTHSTLLNAFYLKKLVRQQRCYLLLKERGPLGHTQTIIVLWWETAALAKHCCRANRHH